MEGETQLVNIVTGRYLDFRDIGVESGGNESGRAGEYRLSR